MSSVLRISGELLDGFPNEGEAERYLSGEFQSCTSGNALPESGHCGTRQQQQQQGFQQLAQQQQQQQQIPLVGDEEGGPKRRRLEPPTYTQEERAYSRALGGVRNIWQLLDFNI